MAEGKINHHGKISFLVFTGAELSVTTDDIVSVGSIVYTTNGGTSRVRLLSDTSVLIDVPSTIQYTSYSLLPNTKICYCLQAGSIGSQVLVKVLN